jgi:hypothetical protein
MSDEKVTEAKIEEVGARTEEVPQKEEPLKLPQERFNEFHKMRETIDARHKNIGQAFVSMLRMAADTERDNRTIEKLFVDSLKEAGISEENFEQYQIDLQSGNIINRKDVQAPPQ